MGLYRCRACKLLDNSGKPAQGLRIAPVGSFNDASGLDPNQDPGKLFVFVFK